MPNELPPHLAIVNDLRGLIQKGAPGYLPGEQLPSTVDLAASYGVAHPTARRALERLSREGFVLSRPSVGHFVRHRPPVRFISLDRFLRATREEGNGAYDVELRRMGYAGRTQWLRLERDVASDADGIGGQPSTAELLDVEPGTPVMVRSRLMYAAPLDAQGRVDYQFEEVVQIATSFIPWDLAEQDPRLVGEHSGPGGVLSRLEELGHPLADHTAIAEVRLGTEEEWVLLHLTPPADVLTLDRRGVDLAGRAVEVCRHVMNPRYVKLQIRYETDPSPDR